MTAGRVGGSYFTLPDRGGVESDCGASTHGQTRLQRHEKSFHEPAAAVPKNHRRAIREDRLGSVMSGSLDQQETFGERDQLQWRRNASLYGGWPIPCVAIS